MNENELNNDSNKNVYRATTNLNIDMENPQIHMNSAVGLNIKNVNNDGNNYDSSYSQNYANSFQGRDDFYKDYSKDMDLRGENNIHSNYSQTSSQMDNYLNNNFSDNSFENTEKTTINHNFNGSDYSTNTIGVSDNNSSEINSSRNYETYVSNHVSGNVEYRPTMEEKKERKSFKIPTEVKVTGFIVFILMIFLLLMPYLYDFFKGLQLALSR